VAFWCADKKSDIDIFIVTKDNKLWSARVIMTLILSIFWLRRKWTDIAWKICLSFWSTSSWSKNLWKLQIESGNDPYLAIWTSTLIPVLNTWYYNELKKHNRWISDYWLVYCNPLSPITNKKRVLKKIFEYILSPKIFENIVKHVFEKRAINKMKKLKVSRWTIITNDILKFHDNDIRWDVRDRL